MLGCDEESQEERQGAPEDCRYCFHAEYEGILGLITRVGKRVDFPHLAENVLFAWHLLEVVYEVPLDTYVNTAAFEYSVSLMPIFIIEIRASRS